jgi:DNA repair photolyase
MFSIKHNISIECDTYIDLYSSCNINCKHCKFQINRTNDIYLNDINYEGYRNKKVLFCYSVDPYPYGFEQFNIVRTAIEKLHAQNCSLVFLTRRAECLLHDLDLFSNNDFVGVSISENCNRNTNEEIIMEMYKKAKALGIRTWMSLEPIYSADYANYIINKYHDVVDFIRIGKDDLITYDWNNITKDIIVKDSPKVFIK